MTGFIHLPCVQAQEASAALPAAKAAAAKAAAAVAPAAAPALAPVQAHDASCFYAPQEQSLLKQASFALLQNCSTSCAA